MTPKVYQGWHCNDNLWLVLCRGQVESSKLGQVELILPDKQAGWSLECITLQPGVSTTRTRTLQIRKNEPNPEFGHGNFQKRRDGRHPAQHRTQDFRYNRPAPFP
jgi:hypothetical protein